MWIDLNLSSKIGLIVAVTVVQEENSGHGGGGVIGVTFKQDVNSGYSGRVGAGVLCKFRQ